MWMGMAGAYGSKLAREGGGDSWQTESLLVADS